MMEQAKRDWNWVSLRERHTVTSFDIVADDEFVVGSADVVYPSGMLCNFIIFPQYRGMGLGTMAVEMFVESCGVNNLRVAPDNDTAIHIYKKSGFIEDATGTHICMRRKEREE